MGFNILNGVAAAGILALSISSCTSFSRRNPASTIFQLQDLLQDRFTQTGYDQTLKRTFKSKAITDEQVVHELAGRAIWFKSAPNERHHTYVFPQKIGVAIDWSQAFLAANRPTRFQTWGLLNDPECCVPGVSCEQKNMKYNGRAVSLTDTYGWEYCSGDEELLNSLKQNHADQYRDPACDDALVKAADRLSHQVRENRCELKFGTSAGAVGFRKYPNPRFNAKRWEKVGGYKMYSEQMIREGVDNSVQPPFRIATACAACHAGFDPLNSPVDPSNPSWADIKGEMGNQYINISKLMASGLQDSTIETQLFTHTRPGAVDTSAVPHDFINNPSTINAILNFPQRPLFNETVLRWTQVDSCDASDAESCQKITYRNERNEITGFKFWKWQRLQMLVPHILKGGEDSTGYDLAIQRVYANIGMCSEQCWQNTLTNLRELDFNSRGYGESPFNIGQCREQCAAFRANEDRTSDLISYLSSRRPVDLKEALQSSKKITMSQNKELVDQSFNDFVESRYGNGSLKRGQQIFAQNCAGCHSSQTGSDYLRTTELSTGEEIRADWMGNDQSTSLKVVGTYGCRALHSNHKKGNVWEQFSSETHKNLPSVTVDLFGNKIAGGPGYYRNISLLSVWAFAPFMHNNAIGPEICGSTDPKHEAVRAKINCEASFDPSVLGRLQIYEKSMDELLTPPSERRKKITRLDAPIKIPLGLKDLYLEFPAGMPLNAIGNFDLKTFIYDFTAAYSILKSQGEEKFNQYWSKKFAGQTDRAAELGGAVHQMINSLNFSDLSTLKTVSKFYRTCDTGDDMENGGHAFGTALSAEDKNALKAFLVTL